MTIEPEVVIDAIKKIHPELELCGYGSEIIQFQSETNNGRWNLLTIKSIFWPNGYKPGLLAERCPWYIWQEKEVHNPPKEVIESVNKILTELQS